MFFPPVLSLTLIHVFALWWASKSTQAHKAPPDLHSKQWAAYPICLFNISIKGHRMDQTATGLTSRDTLIWPWTQWKSEDDRPGKQTWGWISECCESCWVKDSEQIAGHCFLLRERGALITDTPKQNVYHSGRSAVYDCVWVREREREMRQMREGVLNLS